MLQLKTELSEVKRNCNYEKVKGSGKLKFSEPVKKNKTMILKSKNTENKINIEKKLM